MANIKIALAGNPNCGKTTLFNALTGSSQYVGNWPGVTVEKKDGVLSGHKDVVIQDLPGIYALSPYSLEEVVARNYLVNEKPDAILNIVDGSNLERNLYLTTQLLELGLPMVVAVNMCDILKKNGDKLDTAKLAKELGCPVIEISALKGENDKAAAELAIKAAKDGVRGERPHVFTGSVEHAIAHIEESLHGKVEKAASRWAAIKVFERDEKAIETLKVPADIVSHVEGHIKDCEKEMSDDAESIITTQRYAYIQKIVGETFKKSPRKASLTLSDKIDKIVTHRILALPIFILSLCAMWWLAVADGGPGTMLTDWANDGFLGGEGWHLPFTTHECTAEGAYKGMEFEDAQDEFAKQDASKSKWEEAYLEKVNEGKPEGEKVEKMPEKIDEAIAKTIVAKGVFVEDEETGEPVAKECDCEKCSKKREAGEECEGCGCGCGEPELWDVDYAAYQKAAEWEEPDPSAFGVWVPGIGALIGDGLEKVGAGETVKSLVVDGAWGGVATVLGFVPVIFIVFIFLAFLEDCGYMARVAFIMDRLLRRFGLSGKSFIPMLIGTGCGVPGIMASRTIENERDRKMTIMTTTFIPCSAKIPFISMIAGAIFGNSWLVAVSAYFIGMAAIIISGIMLKKTKAFAGKPAPFVMELPAYHWPTLGSVLRSMWERGWSFIKKAGTIILLSTIFVWFTSRFGFTAEGFGMLEEDELSLSILARIGSAIAWIFTPLGWGTWQAAVASFTGLVAKENIVGTMGILYNGDGGAYATIAEAFTRASGYSFLVFNLLCAPCFAAIGAIKREMNNPKWTAFAVAYQCGFAYMIALMVNQFGGIFTGNANVIGIIAAVLVLAFLVFMLVRPYKEATKLTKEVKIKK